MKFSKSILSFSLLPKLLASQVDDSIKLSESLQSPPSDELIASPFSVKESDAFEQEDQVPPTIIETQKVGEKQAILPKHLAHESALITSSIVEKPHVAVTKLPLAKPKDQRDPFDTDKEEESFRVKKVTAIEPAIFKFRNEKWANQLSSALKEDKLKEFLDENSDWHVNEALSCFLLYGNESQLELLKSKLKANEMKESLINTFSDLFIALRGFKYSSCTNIENYFHLKLFERIVEHLYSKFSTASTLSSLEEHMQATQKNFSKFKTIMNVKLNADHCGIHGEILTLEVALFFDLISLSSAIMMVDRPESKGPSLHFASIVVNSLGDTFLYTHHSVLDALKEEETLKHVPLLKDMFKQEGSVDEATYHYMILLLAEIYRRKPSEFLARSFQDLCNIHLTAILGNLKDRTEALEARKLLFESIPIGGAATFYAKYIISRSGHAMLIRVEPNNLSFTDRTYNIRLYNTGGGSLNHPSEKEYGKDNEARRAIYVDFRGVSTAGLHKSEWFIPSSDKKGLLGQIQVFKKLYKEHGVDIDKTHLPKDHYQRVQQSGTCACTVLFAYLRSLELDGRILEAELKHLLILKLLDRLIQLNKVLERRPELEDLLVEIRKAKHNTMLRGNLESRFKDAVVADGSLDGFMGDEIALFIIGDDSFKKLILDSLSAELEYIQQLHSRERTEQAKVLLHLFKKFVRNKLSSLRKDLVGLMIDVRDTLYHNEKITSKLSVEEYFKDLREHQLEYFLKVADCELASESSELNPITFVYLMTVYVQNLTSFDSAKDAAILLLEKFGHLIYDQKYLKDYLIGLFKSGLSDSDAKLFEPLLSQKTLTLDKITDFSAEKSIYKPKPLEGSKVVHTGRVAIKDARSPDYIKNASYLLSNPQHFLYCYAFDEKFFEKILSEPKKRSTSYYVDSVNALIELNNCKE